MARLTIQVLIDTSGSMRGEPIAAALNGLNSLLVAIRSIPDLAENTDISLMTFDRSLHVVQPLIPASRFTPPVGLDVENAPSHLGAVLLLLSQTTAVDTTGAGAENLFFVFTDGSPTDLHGFRLFCQNRGRFASSRFVILLPNSACEKDILQLLSDEVFPLDTSSSSTFRRIIQPNAEAEGPMAGKSKPDGGHLPPPPPEFNLFL